MYKLNNRHILQAQTILNKSLSPIGKSEINYSKKHGLHFNIYKKNFITINLNFLKNFIKLKRNRGELILHPEFVNSEDMNFNFSEQMGKKYKIKEDQEEEEETSSDEDLDFIKLDKNGVPLIKCNFYESLGVAQTASPKEIKKNFLKIAKKYHPDKHPDSLIYFTYICNAYEILMDVHKRAAYDDELLNNSEGVYYIKIWKYKINVFAWALFALSFFVSYYLYEFYKNMRMQYFCPLGDSKFQVDQLKFSDQNLKLLNFIETTKEEIKQQNIKKIAEDDEYEYYVENSNP